MPSCESTRMDPGCWRSPGARLGACARPSCSLVPACAWRNCFYGMPLAWKSAPTTGRGLLKKVSGIEAAASLPSIEGVEITAKVGGSIVALPEGSSYLGFIFARAADPAAAEAALREAHRRLHFEIK